MNYPAVDGVVFDLFGVFAVRWYGLMYVFGFAAFYLLGCWRIRRSVARWTPTGLAKLTSWKWRVRPDAAGTQWTPTDLVDLLWAGSIGVLVGGRLGSMLIYHPDKLLAAPLSLLRIWEGGMSFHGGLAGVLAACWIYARRNGRPLLEITDFVAPLAPIGLGLGRIGNFVNAELPGRPTDLPIGVHFPCESIYGLSMTCFGEFERIARHVSSLYQAAAEGVLLFALVWLFAARPRAAGQISAVFLLGYAALRFLTEFAREPDPHIGFVAFGWMTMGQLLSLPMATLGAALLLRARGSGAQGRKPK